MLLVITGVAYVVTSVLFFALQQPIAQRIGVELIPALLGQVIVMLWLLIRGVRSLND